MRAFASLLGCFCLSTLLGCGGGGTNDGSPSPPSQPSFTLSLSPASVTVMQGGTPQTLQVQVNAQNGFSSVVSISASNLPAGVTISPASLSLNPSSSGALILTASKTASIEQISSVVTGVSGSLTSNASLAISVGGAAIPDPFHFVGGEFSHGYYDEARQLLFVPNPALNEIDILSGTNFSVQERVPAPQPWGIDQMADGNTLVIGTEAQQILTLDENTLNVTSHPVPALGSVSGLFYPNVVALANGKVLIIGQEQGIDSNNILDGGQYLLEWDSTNNSFHILEPGPGQYSWETDSLARSADHKWAIFSADQFYLYSSAADSFTPFPLSTVNPPQNDFGVRGYALNADGSKVAVVSAQQATFLDRSFNVLGTTAIPGAFQGGRTNVTFTPDGRYLLLQYDLPLAIEVLDASNYVTLGFYSGVMNYEDNLERLLAVSSSGLAFVGISGGVRVIDMTVPFIPNPANGVTPGINNSAWCSLPGTTEIPLNMGELVSIPLGSAYYRGVSYYFEGQPAPVLSNGSQIEIPASSTAGGADIECIGPDGNSVMFEYVFSYGVKLSGLSANLLPPIGNSSVYITGYGLSSTPTVSVGGQPITVQATSSPKLPLQIAQVQIPSGAPGASVNVQVSSANGSDSLSQAMTYISAATIIPSSGLFQVLFDAHRNVLYALKATEVDVLNPSTLQWQSPILLPGAGAVSYNMMSLTPDGSRLAIASPSGYVAVVDPNNPSQAAAVATNSIPGISIATSKYNKAILTGSPNVEVDLSTLNVKPLPGFMGQLIRASADGTHLYGADLNIGSGQVYSIDPATYAVQRPPQFGDLFWSDLSVSADGSHFAGITGAPYAVGDVVGFYNPAMNLLNLTVYPLASPPDDTQVLGSTFSPGGKVIVSPLGDSIEFWDTSTGTLRARLMTPEELNVFSYPELSVAPQIALDPTGQTIYAISTSGLTVLQLPQPVDNLPLSPWALSAREAGYSQGFTNIAARMRAIRSEQSRLKLH